MSSPISTKPPSGMRDFLAPDVVRRRHVLSVVQRVYESFGFVPLETPTIENLSTLLGKYGPEGDQLLYRLLHRREKLQRALASGAATEADLADEGLRYDLTVPLARVVANHRDLPQFYKRYQIQPVWRADRPAKGRFREFWQCDVDVTGTASVLADAEVVGAVAQVLRELGFADFRVSYNHRSVLRGMVEFAGVPAAFEAKALIALDKLDKVDADAVAAEMVDKGIADDAAKRLLDVLRANRRFEDLAALVDAGGEPGSHTLGAGVRDLGELRRLVAAGPAAPHFEFDPTLARGLSYYTGPIFEIRVPDLAGSLGGGGRYDGLIGMFQKQPVPAVGFSLGLERILLVMEERGMFPPLGIGPQVLLCGMDGVEPSAAIRAATALRAAGARVEVYPEAAKLGKQLQYANTIGAPFAAILGGNEVASGTVTLKDLAAGTQVTLPLAEAGARVAGAR